MRVRSIVNGVATDASNEVTAVVGGARSNTCRAAPAAPALSASIRGGVVTLTWNAGTAIGSYRLDAGSAPGLANIPTTTLPATLTTLAAAAAPGTYYIRLTAINGCGTSPVSNEVTVTVR